jgi:3-oxoacyl-[acyl-carrier protein] reductase
MTAVPPYPQGRSLLAGKRVLITAAAGTGIGYSTAKRCVEEGAQVFVSDIHERRLGEAVERLKSAGDGVAGGKTCDVTKEADVRALVDQAIATLGVVDVLVNNAGLGGSASVVEMTDEQWLKVLDVSLTSVFRMSRAMLPHMYGRRSGAIVNNASVLGRRCNRTMRLQRLASWRSRAARPSRLPSMVCASMRWRRA